MLSSNTKPEGLGHVLAPSPPSDNGMEINFPAWASLATSSIQIDFRIDSISSDPDNLTQSVQIPLLVSEKATFVDLAEVALRGGCESSQRLKRLIDINKIDSVIFSIDSKKTLFDEQGNLCFDRSQMGTLTPFAIVDTVADNYGVFDRHLEGTLLKWRKYLRSFFNYSKNELMNCNLKNPIITPDTSVQNWIKAGKSPTPHNLRNTNMKAPFTLVCHLITRTQMEDFVINHSFHTEAWKSDLYLPNWILDSDQLIAIQLQLNPNLRCIETTIHDIEEDDSGSDDESIVPTLKLNYLKTRCFQFLA